MSNSLQISLCSQCYSMSVFLDFALWCFLTLRPCCVWRLNVCKNRFGSGTLRKWKDQHSKDGSCGKLPIHPSLLGLQTDTGFTSASQVARVWRTQDSWLLMIIKKAKYLVLPPMTQDAVVSKTFADGSGYTPNVDTHTLTWYTLSHPCDTPGKGHYVLTYWRHSQFGSNLNWTAKPKQSLWSDCHNAATLWLFVYCICKSHLKPNAIVIV